MDEFREIPGFPGYFINESGTRVIGPGGGRWPAGRDLTIHMSKERHGSSYPQVKVGGRERLVHHLMALTFIGPRPEGKAGARIRHLDCNPLNNHFSNLAYGSPEEDAADSIANGSHISLRHRAKTHCPQGHEYTPENTYTTKAGRRNCRACNRRRAREYQRHKSSSPVS